MEKIKLTEKELRYLNNFVKKGLKSARELTLAHILLLVNDGKKEMGIKDTLRIEAMGVLAYEVAAWTKRRNDDERRSTGGSSENADEKLSKYYT